jgi:hypothetical protein
MPAASSARSAVIVDSPSTAPIVAKLAAGPGGSVVEIIDNTVIVNGSQQPGSYPGYIGFRQVSSTGQLLASNKFTGQGWPFPVTLFGITAIPYGAAVAGNTVCAVGIGMQYVGGEETGVAANAYFFSLTGAFTPFSIALGGSDNTATPVVTASPNGYFYAAVGSYVYQLSQTGTVLASTTNSLSGAYSIAAGVDATGADVVCLAGIQTNTPTAIYEYNGALSQTNSVLNFGNIYSTVKVAPSVATPTTFYAGYGYYPGPVYTSNSEIGQVGAGGVSVLYQPAWVQGGYRAVTALVCGPDGPVATSNAVDSLNLFGSYGTGWSAYGVTYSSLVLQMDHVAADTANIYSTGLYPTGSQTYQQVFEVQSDSTGAFTYSFVTPSTTWQSDVDLVNSSGNAYFTTGANVYCY